MPENSLRVRRRQIVKAETTSRTLAERVPDIAENLLEIGSQLHHWKHWTARAETTSQAPRKSSPENPEKPLKVRKQRTARVETTREAPRKTMTEIPEEFLTAQRSLQLPLWRHQIARSATIDQGSEGSDQDEDVQLLGLLALQRKAVQIVHGYPALPETREHRLTIGNVMRLHRPRRQSARNTSGNRDRGREGNAQEGCAQPKCLWNR